MMGACANHITPDCFGAHKLPALIKSDWGA